MQANQQVTFLTDGGEDIRDLPRYLNPQAEHLLDWFHITMRITVHGPAWPRACPRPAGPGVPRRGAPIRRRDRRQLQRLKWFCWHGNVFRALQTVEDLTVDLDVEQPGVAQAKLLKAVREFDGYIDANAGRDPQLRGAPTAPARPSPPRSSESTVNQVISKRMVKKQQMRWTPRGAHLLLQVRTRVLNDKLADDFRRWYPDFTHTRPAGPGRVASHGLSRSPVEVCARE